VDLYQSKIMRHKLCNCLTKLLVKKYFFFVISNIIRNNKEKDFRTLDILLD
jgi:hypothetical protein